MAYATVAQIKEYLNQLEGAGIPGNPGSTAPDDVLGAIVVRATDIIDQYLGFELRFDREQRERRQQFLAVEMIDVLEVAVFGVVRAEVRLGAAVAFLVDVDVGAVGRLVVPREHVVPERGLPGPRPAEHGGVELLDSWWQ